MMPSENAVRQLYARGYIGKEAAVRLLKKREDIIKDATVGLLRRMRGSGPSGGVFGRLAEHLKFKPAKRMRSAGWTGAAPGAAKNDYPGMLANIAKTVGVGGGLAAGAAGVHAGVRAVSDMGLKKKIEQSRNEVLRNMISQGGEHATDTRKKHYEQAFGVLAQYAPNLAANPVVATSLVSNMTSMPPKGGVPQIPGDMIKTLAETEANIERGRIGKGFARSFGELHGKNPHAASIPGIAAG